MKKTLVVLCALIGPCLALAGDWPEFRGPTAQGLYDGKPLPTKWSADRNIKWKQTIPGLGWSSPAVVNGRVDRTPAVPNGRAYSLLLICLDAKTGKVVWDQQVFQEDGASSPSIHSKNSHASPSPVVCDGRIYVHFGHQGSACFDIDGNEVWK